MEEKTLRIILAIFCIFVLIASIIFAVSGITHSTVGDITQTVKIDVYTDKNTSDKININTCSQEALEALPDIGKVLAKRIIDGRPYKDIYELDRVKDIGRDTIEAIRDKVVVK